MAAPRVQIRKLRPDAIVPRYMTERAAGMDLCAAIDKPITLVPGASTAVDTGLALAIPPGFEGQVRPRSGLAKNHQVTVTNAPGTIDADYRGSVMVLLINLGREPFTIEPGARIAQLVIAPVVQAELVEVESLDDTERGAGGFGSSRSPKPTKRGVPAKADFSEDGPTSLYDGEERPPAAPPTVPMRAPNPPTVPANPPAPAQKIVTISMKTPADPNLKPVVPERELPHIKLRAMSEMSRSAIPLNLGNLAPPYDPDAARKRNVKEYLVWSSIAVMLACAIALVVWFVAT